MRRFATVSHTGRSDGDWNLNELSAKAGRMDVLCRNIQSAFFLSH
ncbi:MAG: putative SAM-dependent methyltransferase, partial [Thermoplasmata archaeon]|nr:putative SAM-dependent methyltransferase [Thermoplasmata archaeon]